MTRNINALKGILIFCLLFGHPVNADETGKSLFLIDLESFQPPVLLSISGSGATYFLPKSVEGFLETWDGSVLSESFLMIKKFCEDNSEYEEVPALITKMKKYGYNSSPFTINGKLIGSLSYFRIQPRNRGGLFRRSRKNSDKNKGQSKV